ncbi:MAG: beta-ketoacyl-ACP synthase II [candidate division KSB1 bacterium]|nr:beta-ketoacyl-ACP synthase II [candidate division KSB1 bacterium]
MQKRRVVVTGMGVISPLGHTVEAYWQNLLAGKSGVDRITRFDPSGFDTQFAAEVKNFNAEDYIDKKEARRMDVFTHYALAAAKQAVEQARLADANIDKEAIGVIVSSGIGGMETFEREDRKLFEKGPSRISPFFIPMMIADIAPGYISMHYGFKGPNFAITSACASSSHAIGEGFRYIQLGEAEVMICGGAEATITPMGVGGFNAMKALSTRNDDPQAASRPFDLDRDGFVMGEGAGIVVLESLESALRRDAEIYGEIIGTGYSADAYHITQPAPGGEGAARAMRLALKNAGVAPEQVQYVNAHGTSTPANDKNETQAIATVFGNHAAQLHVNSTKSMIGHLLGASGAVELIATLLSCRHDVIHPTINYTTPDPECYLNYTPNRAVRREVNIAISNSFGFGGHNVCLVVQKFVQ